MRVRKKLREVDATQAQIEAAAKAIGDLEPFEVYDCEKAAEAALTAAAQVGTFEAGPDECDTGVALTKAIDAVLAEDTPLVNHTIERCAQWHDEQEKLFRWRAKEAMKDPCPLPDVSNAQDQVADWHRDSAAAIRKLKETA